MSGSFSSDSFSSDSFSAEGIEDMPSSAAYTIESTQAAFRVVSDCGPYTVRADNIPFRVE